MIKQIMSLKTGIKFILSLWLLTMAHLTYSQPLVDPLDSPSWNLVHKLILSNETVIFDDRVKVVVPDMAEDPMNVPVSVNVDGIGEIEEIRLFADLNPIKEILNFHPGKIEPFIAFRFKVQNSTKMFKHVLVRKTLPKRGWV